ncbi:TPA: hypothetical protein HA239_01515 [Candidatus Woesearchaeota archaeon]|nr:hypothetical protein QT06_C0001G0903 [archaeon GW2011_AR15]MBS3104614.1 hypothetical protein [Candidatus Woesearchaeota archaeon]HIH41071.1 hypothetical protein [Candidatus Woesearchaeota archaeon]
MKEKEKNTVTFKKSNILFVLIVILILSTAYIFSSINSAATLNEQTALEVKFALLSSAHTNSCGGTFNYIDSKSDQERIQGSCCGAMVFHRYAEQVHALKKYSDFEKIPPDPYDVSVSLAKELLDYQKNIILNAEQQEVYDHAVDLSHEGGPCCCKCWHWYAYEGLAKYLITEKGFTAEQIADVWDLSDACGGTGHAHDET